MECVQTRDIIELYKRPEARRVTQMGAKIQRKNYRIDVRKLERTRRILGTRTETETIHRALDLVADEVALAGALRALVLKGRGHIESLGGDR